ncbi:hypothetical protein ACYZT2_18885 [Pseudomonas sp. MDT1-85]
MKCEPAPSNASSGAINVSRELCLVAVNVSEMPLNASPRVFKREPLHLLSGRRPIPLRRYRAFKRTKTDERADRIRLLADQLGLPIAALSGTDVRLTDAPTSVVSVPRQPFDPHAHKYHYPTVIAAKLAIAEELAKPLAKLAIEDKIFIDQVLAETLTRRVVLACVREYSRHKKGAQHAR